MSLKNTINNLIKELSVTVVYRNLDSKGKAIIPLNIVVINQSLSEFEQEQVLLHELEHIRKAHYINKLASPRANAIIEKQAEEGRIDNDLESYITYTPKEYWNKFNFIDYFGIESKYESYIDDQLKRLQ